VQKREAEREALLDRIQPGRHALKDRESSDESAEESDNQEKRQPQQAPKEYHAFQSVTTVTTFDLNGDDDDEVVEKDQEAAVDGSQSIALKDEGDIAEESTKSKKPARSASNQPKKKFRYERKFKVTAKSKP
jgi:hypothetical protein